MLRIVGGNYVFIIKPESLAEWQPLLCSIVFAHEGARQENVQCERVLNGYFIMFY